MTIPPGADATALAVELAWLLLGAGCLGLFARWIKVPYAVALVVAGLLVAESHLVALPRLDPSMVLFIFLPPLLFDAAFRLDDVHLRRLVWPIVWLAVPGTLITALVVGAVVSLALGLPFGAALLFGCMVAATDPVAVVGVFAHLHAPKRLAVIAEGESLVNDGMAITLYTIALALASGGAFDPGHAAAELAWEVLVGVGLGALFALVVSRLTALVDDHLIEMTLSTALAYGSFVAAQSLGASGVLACVAAGLVHGSYGRRVGMSETTRARLDDLWEYLGFLANGLVFLLVGFSASVAGLVDHAGAIAVAVVGVVVARVLVIEVAARAIPHRWRVLREAERLVLIWGGLRGALTVALALALPADTPERALLIELAFGVVLFTLVVQGVTLAPLLRRLGIVDTG